MQTDMTEPGGFSEPDGFVREYGLAALAAEAEEVSEAAAGRVAGPPHEKELRALRREDECRR
jgi:hypothetical protein